MLDPASVKALIFDVFGTVVDWRTSIARESELVLKPKGYALDWLALADAWRDEYQPAMEEVRSGNIPFSKLDVLHRRNLERIFPRFGVFGLDEATMQHLNKAWHRLDGWPDAASGLQRLARERRRRTCRSRASVRVSSSMPTSWGRDGQRPSLCKIVVRPSTAVIQVQSGN